MTGTHWSDEAKSAWNRYQEARAEFKRACDEQDRAIQRTLETGKQYDMASEDFGRTQPCGCGAKPNEPCVYQGKKNDPRNGTPQKYLHNERRYLAINLVKEERP